MNPVSTILAIDIGNTRAKFGVFQIHRDMLVEPVSIVACNLGQTPHLAAELAVWWKSQQLVGPAHSVIAGSDPDKRDALVAAWPFADCEPAVIADYQQIPIAVDVENPTRVGIDRLLNVFAAGQLLSSDRSVIVIDSGTATTVDLMTSDQIFRGGSILPGLRLSAYAMHDYTARLPIINVDDEPALLPEVPGRNTEDAMRAGLFIGQLGAVRELVDRLCMASVDRFAQKKTPLVVVTGGGGRQLVQHLSGATFIDSLALHGLAMLAIGSNR
ncbi:MAG: type III pantothenate kinase [Planctomycetota bacterium]|nr:type III pantothenate kinase [Planctomycetota bacterium]